MNQKELAAALGISGAMVSKLAKRGMPVDDVDRAVKWRRRHLEPTRTKGVRSDTFAASPAAPAHRSPPAKPALHHAHGAAAQPAPLLPASFAGFDWRGPDPELRMAQHLALLADEDFDAHELLLRIFMMLIPPADRPRLAMPIGVWTKLCPPGFLECIAPGYDGSLTMARPAGSVAAGDEPSGESLNVVFEVQCGLRRFTQITAEG